MIKGFRATLLAAGIFSVCAVSAHAQAIGSIFGKVTDASGAVLPGVTVTVTGTGLQQPLVGISSESGTYQFPSVPVGTYAVTFELASFKKSVRSNIVITAGFNAPVDQKLEIGQMSEEVTISAASPVVDTKKTTTGATFTAEILEKIPTARDVQQIVNMTPGVQLSGYNVGGSASGQQLTPTSRGTSSQVQWNLEGGLITDLSSNSSALYYNFDSFDQIQVTSGGGDVSVQASGLSINLVTKSGSNVFKGSFNGTFENDKTQGDNVTKALFDAGGNGFLSGNPLHRISVYSIEAGGPIKKDKLWYWGAFDRQDINVGITNFFDPNLGTFCNDLIAAQRNSQLSAAITYNDLSKVQDCLKNDKTLITDINGKVNYQISAKHKLGFLLVTDDKFRNARGASATTLFEASQQQNSPKRFGMHYPTIQAQHTWIASDRLVFNTLFTTLQGEFFLDYQDFGTCGSSTYTGASDPADYASGPRASADCLWNTQSLNNRTTGVNSRSLLNSYQTRRYTYEAKTDGTYFLTHMLGGDHSLKFGLGYKKAPILSFSHYSGGARANVQCVGNSSANCGNGQMAAAGSTIGVVARSAVVYRDFLVNNDWWSYNGYIQDSYSRGRWRLNGGLRYDWQQSKYLGGCVPANPMVPNLLPAQCESAASVDASSGRKLQAFNNWSPRGAATYDLFGNGKTSIHASGSVYYAQKITIANGLSGITTATFLTWGTNTANGSCTGTSCWTDLNLDSKVQVNELSGTPTASSTRFNLATGVLSPAGNIVDPSAKIARTREGIVGIQHELVPNLAVGVDYIYRKYDRGTATYPIGYQPGAPGFPLASLYVPTTYTDAVTGITAPYYVLCPTCTRPSGIGNITVTTLEYQTYQGVDFTATKRYSNKWQLQTALTIQKSPLFFPVGSTTFNDPTGQAFRDGVSTTPKYNLKMNGSYTLPWELNASANYNLIQGGTRTLTVNGPGTIFGGVGQTTLTKDTLEFTERDTERFKPVGLLDLSLAKNFAYHGSSRQIRLIFDAFNVLNENTITSYSSGNKSTAAFTQPTVIIAPRVFRFGTRITF
jgi:Carboxypeptidase regulatory-like domain